MGPRGRRSGLLSMQLEWKLLGTVLGRLNRGHVHTLTDEDNNLTAPQRASAHTSTGNRKDMARLQAPGIVSNLGHTAF
jgi:hypothetical protein